MSAAARAWAETLELPADEMRLLSTLGHYAHTVAGRRVVCGLSQPTLVRITGLSKHTIQALLTSLESQGLISWDHAPVGRAPTVYTLHLTAVSS